MRVFLRQSSQFVYTCLLNLPIVTTEQDKLKKISALLERGGTMLAKHHECGAPLFKYHGKVVCPLCDSPLDGVVEQKQDVALGKPVETGQMLSPSDTELREALLAYARGASKHLTGGDDTDADAIILSNIETAIRCASNLK